MIGLISHFQEAIFEGTPSISLPLWQIILFFVLVSGAAIFGKHRVIALFCYAFLFQLLLAQNVPVYTMNESAILALGVACLIAIAGLIATCYQMLHRCD